MSESFPGTYIWGGASGKRGNRGGYGGPGGVTGTEPGRAGSRQHRVMVGGTGLAPAAPPGSTKGYGAGERHQQVLPWEEKQTERG